MEFQNNPYLIWQLIPGIILLGIGFYIQSRPVKKRESNVFSFLMFSGALWAITNAVQLITPDLGWQRFWNGVTYLGIMVVPTGWFLLAVKLTGFAREQIERIEKWLWVPPGILYLFMLTSGIHRLFFTSYAAVMTGGYVILENKYGLLFYVNTVYSYILIISGTIMLVISLATKFKQYGVQAYGLIIGVLAPLLGNAYFLFGSPPEGFPDPTPIIFTVTGAAFAWAIFGGHILEVVPLAHDTIVRKLSTGVLIVDSERNIRDINPAALAMLGLPSDIHSGDSLSKLARSNSDLAMLIDQVVHNAVRDDQETQIAFPESRRTVDVYISHIADKLDNTTGWLIQFTDISEQKQVEENLVTTQKTLRAVLDTLQDSFFEADQNGVITYANRALINNLEFSRWEDVQGKNFRNFTDQSTAGELDEKFQSLYETAQPLEPFESNYRTKADRIFIGETTISPIMEGDKVIGSRGLIHDITARINAEKEILKQKDLLDSILEQSPLAMVINDMEKRITAVNPAFEKLFGYSQQEALEKSLDDLLSPVQNLNHTNEFSALSMTKKEARERRRRRKDGTLVDVEIFTTPFFVGGEQFGYLAFYNDISERIKTSEVLKNAKDAAEARAGELAAVNRVAAKVSESLDLMDILNTVCHELTHIFRIRNAGIGLLTPDRKNLEIVAFDAIDPQEKSALGLLLPVEGNTSTMEVLQKRKTIFIQDAQSDPRTSTIADISKRRGTKSIMIVPLLARGEAIGTIGMPASDPDYEFSRDDIELAEIIASQIAAAIDNAQLYAKTESALGVAERDLEIGRQIQSGFFPEELPNLPGWEIAAHFHAARQVAGDFYDVFQIKNSNFTAFVIADVCDKGVGAALFMVLFRSLLRAFSEIKINVDNVREQLLSVIVNTNNFIAEYHGNSNMFATMFFGVLDPDTGILYYINGGHEPPIVLNQRGEIIQRLMPTGPAVGMFSNMGFRAAQIQLDQGDTLFGFTDGTTDAMNTSRIKFSEARLLKTIAMPWSSIFSMIFELNMELQAHIGEQPQFDDITLLSFRRKVAAGHGQHAICRPARLDALQDLRDFVESAAVYSGLSHENVFAFKLAVDELCANIIQYGFEGQTPGVLSLAFEVQDDLARLIIQDDGIFFPPDQAHSPNIEADWSEREIGGLGIHLVKELMDNVTYNRTSENLNQFILEKKLNGLNSKKE